MQSSRSDCCSYVVRFACATALAIVLYLPIDTAQAGSIFDDNWTPPEAPQPPAPPPHDPLPAPVELRQPDAPAVPPESVTAPAPTPPARSAIPDHSSLTTSRKLLREIYAKELKERAAPARRAFAGKLIADADRSEDNPTDQFVLLSAALAAAEEGISLPLSFQVADRMDNRYLVSGLALKIEATTKVSAMKPDSS